MNPPNQQAMHGEQRACRPAESWNRRHYCCGDRFREMRAPLARGCWSADGSASWHARSLSNQVPLTQGNKLARRPSRFVWGFWDGRVANTRSACAGHIAQQLVLGCVVGNRGLVLESGRNSKWNLGADADLAALFRLGAVLFWPQPGRESSSVTGCRDWSKSRLVATKRHS